MMQGELNKLLSSATSFQIQTTRSVTKNEIESYHFNKKINIDNNKLAGELDTVKQLTELLDLLQQSGHKIEQVEFGKQSLESMYCALTDQVVRE